MIRNSNIPQGMIEKQLRWEYVNFGIYNHLTQAIRSSMLTDKIENLLEVQKKQLIILQQMNSLRGNSSLKGLPKKYEGSKTVDELLDELTYRENQLLLEYKSYKDYFFINSPDMYDYVNSFVENKSLQLNVIADIKQCFTREGNSERQEYFLEEGYQLEKVASDLTYPTAITFDDNNNLYLIEAGYSYGATPGQGRIVKVNKDGSYAEVAGGFKSPLTGITWHKGYFYVAEGATAEEADPGCGKVLRVSPKGQKEVIVSNLRSCGDHFTGDVEIGPDGKLYFTVGTATNSGVVGTDNLAWVREKPEFHDVPARDFVLKGKNFTTRNPLSEEEDITETGAFKPFGEASKRDEVIRGNLYANGVVYRSNLDGSNLEVYADGFRMPFGLEFSPINGKMYVTDNGADLRGSRPVYQDWDNFWEVTEGGWHGWPDFFSGLPATRSHFHKKGEPKLNFLIKNHPPLASQPVVRFETHSSSDKFSFSINDSFGYEGQAFVGQLGGMDASHGMKVVRVNIETGQVKDFYVNKKALDIKNGPMRPVAATFNPAGDALYVVDFGFLGKEKETGGLWKITRKK